MPGLYRHTAYNLIFVILLAASALMICLLLAGNALIDRGLFPSGTTVDGYSLDGMSFEEGREFVLAQNEEALNNYSVVLNYKGQPITLDAQELGIVAHIESLLYSISYSVERPHSLSGIAAIIYPKKGQSIDISPLLDISLVQKTLQSALSFVEGEPAKNAAANGKTSALPITGTNELGDDEGNVKVYLTVNIEEFNDFAAQMYEQLYPPPDVDDSPIVVTKERPYSDLIEKYAKECNLEPAYIAAVIYVESGFVPDSVSTVGAVGLMQIMPSTGRWIAGQMGMDSDTLDLLDPETNIRVGCWYLAYLLDFFGGNIHTSTVAYNAGPVRVRGWLQDSRYSSDGKNLDTIPYEETKVHTDLIESFYEIYKDTYKT